MPPFLRNRKAIYTPNVDAAVDQLEYILQHPAETQERGYEQAEVEREKRLNELKNYALALKEGTTDRETKPQ